MKSSTLGGHTLFFISGEQLNILHLYISYRRTLDLYSDTLHLRVRTKHADPETCLDSASFKKPRLTVGGWSLLACVQWGILFYTTEDNEKSADLRLN